MTTTHDTQSPLTPTEVCFSRHAAGDPVYVRYHDEEWGRPLRGEAELFERVCLEGFQVGLSWRTVLHKREAFRTAFAGFDPAAVARCGEADVERLLADPAIIRNRAKIQACIRGARIVCDLHEQGRTLSDLIWSYRPPVHARPTAETRLNQSPEAVLLSQELHRLGFRFIGPVNTYATMQACGLVNDHVVGCVVGDAIEVATRGDVILPNV